MSNAIVSVIDVFIQMQHSFSARQISDERWIHCKLHVFRCFQWWWIEVFLSVVCKGLFVTWRRSPVLQCLCYCRRMKWHFLLWRALVTETKLKGIFHLEIHPHVIPNPTVCISFFSGTQKEKFSRMSRVLLIQ